MTTRNEWLAGSGLALMLLASVVFADDEFHGEFLDAPMRRALLK